MNQRTWEGSERRRSPLFTIVTPVFNGMPWLPEAIDSVLSQVETSVELIVLDGGSTDGSREWLAGNVKDRAQMVFEPDRGQTDALIRGLTQARGVYLGWLNADDRLEPAALARVAAAFDDAPDASVVSGCCLEIDESGAITGLIPTPPSATLKGLLAHPHNLAQPATFFRTEAYGRVGGLDPDLDLAMDVDLWMRLALTGRVVLLRDQVLARFRIHSGAKSVTRATATVREDLKVRRRHGMPRTTRAWWVLFKRAYLRPLKRLRLR
jgi:glycosyltransferase involved in cell wall biosynthesis